MGIYRMYTGPDNETHIEELPLSAHPELGQLQTVKGMQIQQNDGGRFLDFHQAPNMMRLNAANLYDYLTGA